MLINNVNFEYDVIMPITKKVPTRGYLVQKK